MKKKCFFILVAGALSCTNLFSASDRKKRSQELKEANLQTEIMYSKEKTQEEYIACLEHMIAEHSSDIQLAVNELRDVFNQRRKIMSVGGRSAGDVETPEQLVDKLTPLYCNDPETVKAIIALLPEHIRTTIAAEEDADLILKLISAFMFSRARKGTKVLNDRCFVELHSAINEGSMEFSFDSISSTFPPEDTLKKKNTRCLLL